MPTSHSNTDSSAAISFLIQFTDNAPEKAAEDIPGAQATRVGNPHGALGFHLALDVVAIFKVNQWMKCLPSF